MQLQMLISLLVIGYAVVINGQFWKDSADSSDQIVNLTEIEPPSYSVDGTTVKLCASGRCTNASLASYVSSGMFVTEAEQKALTDLEYRNSSQLTASKSQFVFSFTCGCCKTYQYFTNYTRLWNTAMDQCYIIHLSNSRQYTTVGLCSYYGNCMGGQCRQKYAYRTLLAWCPTHFFWSLKFHLFRLPSHCVCE